MADNAKPKWRQLSPNFDTLSAEKAVVLGLHHVEMALAFLNCIEPESEPGDNLAVDSLDRSIRNNEKRRRFMLAALDARYPKDDGFRDVAAALINAQIDGDNALVRKDLEG